MRKLILLYWGCAFLLYLSHLYYPAQPVTEGQRQTGRWHFMLQHADYFMIIVIIWMTCFSFLRTSYNDTDTYIHGWRNAISIEDFLARGGLRDLTGNPLSEFWRVIAHSISDNYHIYFLLPAVLSSVAVVKLFKRYSINPAFSLLIFFSIGTYIMYVAALKQCFAIFFLLTSIPYAEEKKYVRFYVLVAVAILFHTHAFMFAILPLLFGKPWGAVIWGLFLAAVFAMLTYNVTLGAFMEYAQSIGALVEENELFDGHKINVIRVIVYWVPSFISFFYRKRLFTESTRYENLFANMAVVSSLILMMGLVQGANLFARMAGYFEIATAVSLPWMIHKLLAKRSERFITVCAILLYFGYFLYEFGVTKNLDGDYQAITLWEFLKSFIHF